MRGLIIISTAFRNPATNPNPPLQEKLWESFHNAYPSSTAGHRQSCSVRHKFTHKAPKTGCHFHKLCLPSLLYSCPQCPCSAALSRLELNAVVKQSLKLIFLFWFKASPSPLILSSLTSELSKRENDRSYVRLWEIHRDNTACSSILLLSAEQSYKGRVRSVHKRWQEYP